MSVVKVLRGLRDGDDEDEVEQQLAWRRHAMRRSGVCAIGRSRSKAHAGEDVGHATIMVEVHASRRRIMATDADGLRTPYAAGLAHRTSSPWRSAPDAVAGSLTEVAPHATPARSRGRLGRAGLPRWVRDVHPARAPRSRLSAGLGARRSGPFSAARPDRADDGCWGFGLAHLAATSGSSGERIPVRRRTRSWTIVYAAVVGRPCWLMLWPNLGATADPSSRSTAWCWEYATAP